MQSGWSKVHIEVKRNYTNLLVRFRMCCNLTTEGYELLGDAESKSLHSENGYVVVVISLHDQEPGIFASDLSPLLFPQTIIYAAAFLSFVQNTSVVVPRWLKQFGHV